MTIRISRELLARIIELASASPETEICGLLLGQEGAIEAMVPAANVAEDPVRRFEIDPGALFETYRLVRAGTYGNGTRVIGHYHSHPAGEVAPSACDAGAAHGDGALWLICAPAGNHALWRAAGEGLHGQFVPMTLECGD